MAAGVFFFAPAKPTLAAWGVPCPIPQARSAPPDQSWMKDVPEKPGARSRGKIAVFPFQGDDVYEQSRGAVVRALRKQGLIVTATLRPADSPAMYREMSYSSNLAVFIDGEVSGDEAHRIVQVRLRSGVSGQYFTNAKFTGSAQGIPATILRSLWTRIGPATVRACVSAGKPRKRESKPMYIEAGTPIEST